MKEVFLLTIPTMESVTFQKDGLFFTHTFKGVYTAQFDDMAGVERCMSHLRSGELRGTEFGRTDNMYMIFGKSDGSTKSCSTLYLDKSVVQTVQRV